MLMNIDTHRKLQVKTCYQWMLVALTKTESTPDTCFEHVQRNLWLSNAEDVTSQNKIIWFCGLGEWVLERDFFYKQRTHGAFVWRARSYSRDFTTTYAWRMMTDCANKLFNWGTWMGLELCKASILIAENKLLAKRNQWCMQTARDKHALCNWIDSQIFSMQLNPESLNVNETIGSRIKQGATEEKCFQLKTQQWTFEISTAPSLAKGN